MLEWLLHNSDSLKFNCHGIVSYTFRLALPYYDMNWSNHKNVASGSYTVICNCVKNFKLVCFQFEKEPS